MWLFNTSSGNPPFSMTFRCLIWKVPTSLIQLFLRKEGAHFWLCAKLNSGVNNEHFYAFPHSPEQNLKYWGANRRHLHFPDYGTARKTHAEQQVLSSVCLSVNKLILKYQMLMVWPFFNAFSSLFSLLFKIHIPSKSFLTLQLLPTWNRQIQRDWKHFQCYEFIWF